MKSFKHYLLVIAISLLPFISIFATNLAPHTHDSPVHYARMAAYYKALTEGQILPRWAGELNYGYGMPLFNFIYHVPYLITSATLALGAGLVTSLKIALALSYVLSGVFMFSFSQRFFKHDGKAFITTMLYQFAPFHLVDLVVRGDMAEGFAQAMLPLVLYALIRENVLFIGISALLLIASHNSMSLLFFGIATLFALIFTKNRLKTLSGLGLGLLLSAFYWLPALIERKYTYGDLFMKNMYTAHFAPFLHFFLPNFTNSRALQTEGIAVSFGLVQVCVLAITIFMVLKKSMRSAWEKKVVWFGLGLTVAALFVMQPVSQFMWSGIPILRMFQFPWRLLNITTFSLALIGGVVLVRKGVSLRVLISIAAITIISAGVYYRPPWGFDKIDEAYYWNYPLNTTYFGETDVVWSAGPAGSYPEKRFEVIGGEGDITNQVKKGTIHTFTVTAQTDVQVVDRTQYFPGWRVYSNGQKMPIEFQDQNWRGLITFRLPPGTHAVRVVWEESPIRQISEGITLLALIGSAGFLVLSKFRLYKK